MKVNYIQEKYFPTKSNRITAKEKEQQISDVDKISNIASNVVIFDDLARSMEDGFATELIERFSDILAFAIDSFFDDSVNISTHLDNDTGHNCSDTRASKYIAGSYSSDNTWCNTREERIATINKVKEFGKKLSSALKTIRPIIWSKNSNATDYCKNLRKICKVADGGIVLHTDQLLKDAEFYNIIKSDERVILVKFSSHQFGRDSYIDDTAEEVYMQNTFNLNMYMIASGHNLDEEGVKEYNKIMAKYDINEEDPEIDKYFAKVYQEVMGSKGAGIQSDLAAIKKLFEDYMIERIYDVFLAEKNIQMNDTISNKIKQRYPIHVSMTICRCVKDLENDNVKSEITAASSSWHVDKPENFPVRFVPIQGINKYLV